ncbi:MAG: 3-isopropylmalate dehydratase small subunit [Actinomycetota bacterium]
MEPVRRIEGTAVPLDRSDVDTDQIVPAQFLKRIERTGFGPFLFHEWRKDPAFVLNDARYAGATILLAGANFGGGSSREHAPWALEDFGFRTVIAQSFADIFRNNCCKIGLLPVELPLESVRALMDAVLDDPTTRIAVDLETLTVAAPSVQETFAFDDFRRWCLLEGYDDIDLTLRHTEAIASYEATRPPWLPTA